MSDHRPRLNSAKLFNEFSLIWDSVPSTPKIECLILSSEMPALNLDFPESPCEFSEFLRDDDKTNDSAQGEDPFEEHSLRLKKEVSQRQVELKQNKRARFQSEVTVPKHRKSILNHFLCKKKTERKANETQLPSDSEEED